MAFGQFAVADVNGSATDQTEAALPGATIILTQENIGLTRPTVTNESTSPLILPADRNSLFVRQEGGYK
jgi:hypothetical protein